MAIAPGPLGGGLHGGLPTRMTLVWGPSLYLALNVAQLGFCSRGAIRTCGFAVNGGVGKWVGRELQQRGACWGTWGSCEGTLHDKQLHPAGGHGVVGACWGRSAHVRWRPKPKLSQWSLGCTAAWSLPLRSPGQLETQHSRNHSSTGSSNRSYVAVPREQRQEEERERARA